MARTALVTGAASGIGRATAHRLAREGKAVGVLDLNPNGAASVAAEILALGGKAVAVSADITRREEVVAAVAKVREALGPITILVNNAGVAGFAPFYELTDEHWNAMFAVNANGTFIVSQVVTPDMQAEGWGRVINISSSCADTGYDLMAHYGASKGAVTSFTRSLMHVLGPHGVTVNTVAPGTITQTMMNDAAAAENYQDTDALRRTIPVRRVGVPEDIANAVCWLASEDSGYVSGQVIGVNGGVVVG